VLQIGDGAELEVVRDPRTTLDPERIESMAGKMLALVRAGFGNEGFTERQVVAAGIDVPYGAFVHRAGELVGISSAELLVPEGLSAPVLYLGTAALAPRAQGHGFYHALLLARLAIGAVAGATYFTTRTQSPIVCRTLKDFRPYPFGPGSERHRAAALQIARALDGHGPRSPAHPGGQLFDQETGVVRRAYDASLYSVLPWSGDREIDGYIEAHLSVARGDALILVGSPTRAALDERCRRTLGFGFDDLMAHVAPVVGLSG